MRTQIDQGIFDYCGASLVTSEFLVPSETQDSRSHLDTARVIGRHLFKAPERRAATEAA